MAKVALTGFNFKGKKRLANTPGDNRLLPGSLSRIPWQAIRGNSFATHHWAGIIGSTTAAYSFSKFPWRGFAFVRYFSYYGDRMIVGTGYGEGAGNVFTVTHDTLNEPLMYENSFMQDVSDLVTDGELDYICNNAPGWDENNSTFIWAKRVSDGRPYIFPTGVSMQYAGSHAHDNDAGKDSVLFLVQKPGGYDEPHHQQYYFYGIDVERGNILGVATRKDRNEIYIWHKKTGQLLQTINATKPGKVRFDIDGNLWVGLQSGEARKYINQGTRTNPNFQFAFRVEGVIEACAFANRPNGDVLIQDSGRRNVVRTVNRTTGQIISTFPEIEGGTSVNAKVTDTTWWFVNREGLGSFGGPVPRFNLALGCLEVAPDGTLYLLDGGNMRVQRWSQDWKLLDEFGYNSDFFKVAVDLNKTDSLFHESNQYKIDLSQGFQPGNQKKYLKPSWLLNYNWNALLPTSVMRFLHVATWTVNGKTATYALAHNRAYDALGGGWKQEFIELNEQTGIPRMTGIIIDYGPNTGRNKCLQADNCLRWWEITGTSEGLRQCGYEQKLIDIDNNRNPVFAPITKEIDFLAQPNGTERPISLGGWNQSDKCFVTADGHWISCSLTQRNVGTKLVGGIKKGMDNWAWTALECKLMRNEAEHVYGFGPALGSGSNFGGHDYYGFEVIGNDIIVCYDGQAGHFSNQKWHFKSDGTFIKQFGRNNRADPDFTDPNSAPIAYANNAGTTAMLKYNGNLYVFNTDESCFGGVHVWEVLL